MKKLSVVLIPQEIPALAQADLSSTACAVFDVLRATSTIVTALAHGADSVIPVAGIPQALELGRQFAGSLLAGERQGQKIGPALTGGREFDLGNSPVEFSQAMIASKTIISTTSNGTAALRACSGAKLITAASFLNLRATAEYIKRIGLPNLTILCSGTGDEASFEDVLGAGALCDLIWADFGPAERSDSAQIARAAWLAHRGDLFSAIANSRNGRLLLGWPALRRDVEFCTQRDIYGVVAVLGKDARIRKAS